MSKNYSICKYILQKRSRFYEAFKSSASCSSWGASGDRVNVIVTDEGRLELEKPSFSFVRKDKQCESKSLHYCIGGIRKFSMQSYRCCKSKSDDSGKGGDGNGNENKDKANKDSNSRQPYEWKEDNFFTKDSAFGSSQNKGLGESERPVFVPEEKPPSSSPPPSPEEDGPPTNCCMSGCVNCVWIDYVETLTKKYTDPELTREQVLKALNEIDDPNVKTFIMMELKSKKLL